MIRRVDDDRRRTRRQLARNERGRVDRNGVKREVPARQDRLVNRIAREHEMREAREECDARVDDFAVSIEIPLRIVLLHPLRPAVAARIAAGTNEIAPVRLDDDLDSCEADEAEREDVLARVAMRKKERVEVGDRKSTRLNSSHGG